MRDAIEPTLRKALALGTAAMLVATLSALAEPNRLRIVDLLREGPRPVGEIVGRLRLQQPQVSKHLRTLGEAGLVVVRPEAQRRIYALRPGPLRELDEWLEGYRRLWEGNYRRLDALLDERRRAVENRQRRRLLHRGHAIGQPDRRRGRDGHRDCHYGSGTRWNRAVQVFFSPTHAGGALRAAPVFKTRQVVRHRVGQPDPARFHQLHDRGCRRNRLCN